MNNKIPQIKQELDRRFHVCSDSKTTFWGFLVFAQNYTDFVKNTPLLTQIVESEIEKFKKNFKGLDKITFDRIDDGIIPISYPWFDRETNRLIAERRAIKKTFWNLFLRKIKDTFIPKKSKEHHFRTTLNLIHGYLMKVLSAYEIGSFKHTVKQSSEVIRSLGITDKTTWEELAITFINDYDVKITHGEKEYLSNHEKMGFADKRKRDQTHAIDCWNLLQLLGDGNGVLKISRNDKEKIKKQKQELVQKLKEYFQIDSDPFYKAEGDVLEYKARIKITPSKEFRDDWRDRKISDTPSRPEFLKSIDSL